jgi:hypothetical protein
MNEKCILASLCFLASSPSIQFSQFSFLVLPLTSSFNQAVAKGVTVGIKAQTGRWCVVFSYKIPADGC